MAMEIQSDPSGLGLLVSAPEFDAKFEVFGQCPVQATGEVLGRDLYFRARHGEWSFDVANADGHLPSDGYSGGFYREGQYPDAGYMPHQKAVTLIAKCLREF